MKRILCWVILIALCFAGCSAPAAAEPPLVSESASAPQMAEASDAADELEAALQAATSIEEVGQIMKPYVMGCDYESALRCTDRMLEIDPDSDDAWYTKAEITLLSIKAEQDQLSGIVTEGIKKWTIRKYTSIG